MPDLSSSASPSIEPNAIVMYADLSARFGVTFTKTHLSRLEAAGKFPRRISITAGRCAWLQAEIREWLAARIEARDTATCRQVPKPVAKGAPRAGAAL